MVHFDLVTFMDFCTHLVPLLAVVGRPGFIAVAHLRPS